MKSGSILRPAATMTVVMALSLALAGAAFAAPVADVPLGSNPAAAGSPPAPKLDLQVSGTPGASSGGMEDMGKEPMDGMEKSAGMDSMEMQGMTGGMPGMNGGSAPGTAGMDAATSRMLAQLLANNAMLSQSLNTLAGKPSRAESQAYAQTLYQQMPTRRPSFKCCSCT